jgi:pyruvate,water dikinase
VQGIVDPDKYMVFTPLLDDPSLAPIIERPIGAQERKMVYGRGSSARTRTVDTTQREREAVVLEDGDILQLARWAVVVAKHYGRAMDIAPTGPGRLQARTRAAESEETNTGRSAT